MQVRPASEEDAAAIANVHVASWKGAYRGILPDSLLSSLSVERRAQAWRANLRRPENNTFVALDGAGTVVGFASLEGSRDSDASKDTGEITTIYVIPDKWGHGYGRVLMEVVCNAARNRGFADLTLWVLEENVRARQFYEKAGFTLDGATKTETRPEDVVF